MSYVDYPITYTSVFAYLRESDQLEMETNAMSLAQDEYGPLPYEIEIFITPGRIVKDDFFQVERQSNFMVRVIVFADDRQKNIYLEKRRLRYSQQSLSSKQGDNEDNQNQT